MVGVFKKTNDAGGSQLDTVVSYRGTWIETTRTGRSNVHLQSYLIEVRGLKRLRCKYLTASKMSYLIEVRGLKLYVFSRYKGHV